MSFNAHRPQIGHPRFNMPAEGSGRRKPPSPPNDTVNKDVAKTTQAKARELLRQATLRAGHIDDGGFARKKRGPLEVAKAVIPVREIPSLLADLGFQIAESAK